MPPSEIKKLAQQLDKAGFRRSFAKDHVEAMTKAGIGVTEKSQDLEELEKFTAQLTKKMAQERDKALAEGA